MTAEIADSEFFKKSNEYLDSSIPDIKNAVQFMEDALNRIFLDELKYG